ncbi:hypothetical protein [Methylobacterium sp. J-070]|uniref:hypothetical protein n=1 Tax=Methylobacterium sp. J-070 TaxID=2836650 RepID=UPI001FBB8ABD|nr:hypothetical protein [Methylobacterium sp. J-070]MCJ2048700.1 hypothetical protein [Methylobacterium sp. J-070]
MSSQPRSSPSSGPDSDAIEEAQFRARMARLGPDTGRGRGRRGARPGQGRGFRLGWTGWLVVNGLVVVLAVVAVLAVPPTLACRHQDRTIGFYAGDSVDRCIWRGMADRLDTADQRLKRLIRGSGR